MSIAYLRKAVTPILIEHWESLGSDAHGNEIIGYSTPIEVMVFGVSPREATEATELPTAINHQNTTMWGWTVYAPQGIDIRPKDRVTYAGQTFEVIGEAEVWTNGPYSGAQVGQTHNLKSFGEAKR